jgi:hypothetical protein
MASAALRNPIRVRLLEAMNLGHEVSATSFINDGFGKGVPGLTDRTYEQQTADAAYHLRALAEADCIYLSREEPRRGATEKFYKAKAVAYFSDDEWVALKQHQRKAISRVVAQGFIVQIEGAILADTFDSRADRWLLYEPLRLDEQGWSELRTTNAAHYAEVQQIKREAEARLDAEGEDADPIQTTFGVASFESPDLPDFATAEVNAAPDD